MGLEIHQFACLEDNYGYLIRDQATGISACIDTPDGHAVVREAQLRNWPLNYILNTHWHWDHAGGNQTVQRAFRAKVIGSKEITKASAVDHIVSDGDIIPLGDTQIKVMITPGHTLMHACYYIESASAVFVGDTLFSMGCGRVMEGTMADMWRSLQRLTALPGNTKVYSAHEYTQANCRFALTVDQSSAVTRRAQIIAATRARGQPTVPSLLSDELATNPFLRASQLITTDVKDDIDAFSQIRNAKDRFRAD